MRNCEQWQLMRKYFFQIMSLVTRSRQPSVSRPDASVSNPPENAMSPIISLAELSANLSHRIENNTTLPKVRSNVKY